MAEVFESMFPRNKECRSIIEGCISNCRRLVGTPAGAAAVGSVFTAHMKQSNATI